MFKVVKRDTTLSERTEQQLEELILNRSLRPGDRLPSQEELGRLLGVSRTVIREAVQLLTAKGLLEGRKGSGIYVRALGFELVQRPVNLLARSHMINQAIIMEARDLLEPKLAELAAQRRQPADIAILEDSVRSMSGKRLSPVQYAATDLAFHNQLATAAGNPLLHAMAISINDVLINAYHLATNLYGTDWICERARHHHSRILEQIKLGDPEGARRAMEEHLTFSRDVLGQLESTMADGTAPKSAGR